MKKLTLTILSLFLISMTGYLDAQKNEQLQNCSNNYSQRFETKNVQQTINGGLNFHIANYIDGTCIITYLDGAEKGLQGIFFNGVLQNGSTLVEWHKNHFIHFYQYGRVTSYCDRQIAELY